MKITGLTLLLLACLFFSPALSCSFDNQAALGHLMQTKAVFDVNQGYAFIPME